MAKTSYFRAASISGDYRGVGGPDCRDMAVSEGRNFLQYLQGKEGGDKNEKAVGEHISQKPRVDAGKAGAG